VTAGISKNDIHATTDAHATGTATLTAAGDVGLTAQNTSHMLAVTGQGGGALVGVGGVASYNEIANVGTAYADHATLTSTGGNIQVSAGDQVRVDNFSVSGNGGFVGVAGSVSINILQNAVSAYLAASQVDAFGNVTVLASYAGTLDTWTG